MDPYGGSAHGRHLPVTATFRRNAGKSKKQQERQEGKSERFLSPDCMALTRHDLTQGRGQSSSFPAFPAFLPFLPFLLFLLLFSFGITVGFLPRFLAGKNQQLVSQVSLCAHRKLVRPIGGPNRRYDECGHGVGLDGGVFARCVYQRSQASC